MSAAATRPTTRVRASAAALKLALLFILLTPNRNHGSRTAAVDADDRPLGAQRYGTPSTRRHRRSEEHTSELQSLMRISYAVFCLKKKTQKQYRRTHKIRK